MLSMGPPSFPSSRLAKDVYSRLLAEGGKTNDVGKETNVATSCCWEFSKEKPPFFNVKNPAAYFIFLKSNLGKPQVWESQLLSERQKNHWEKCHLRVAKSQLPNLTQTIPP